ncbi:hypothetical protein XF30_21335 [Bradyrhizobium sp. SUTN9-2]|nr:hypothetical protein XF30_21335 [Bradyrhizobium sp. SUTN9-2]
MSYSLDRLGERPVAAADQVQRRAFQLRPEWCDQRSLRKFVGDEHKTVQSDTSAGDGCLDGMGFIAETHAGARINVVNAGRLEPAPPGRISGITTVPVEM